MNSIRYLLVAISWILGFTLLTAQAADSIRGQVVDESGKPLDGVTWWISAIEELHDGKWILVIYSGMPSEHTTDSNGCFIVPFHGLQRYDLQFHKSGFAPAFLFEVAADSPEIKVTLKQGEIIHGTVSRRVDWNLMPVRMEEVVLRLPCRDVWYQERVFTDHNGRFEFHACAPPSDPSGHKRKWQVVLADKAVEIDVRDGEPVDAVDFEIFR
jgi:hypothetical protein